MNDPITAAIVVSAFFTIFTMVGLWICDRISDMVALRRWRKAFNAPQDFPMLGTNENGETK